MRRYFGPAGGATEQVARNQRHHRAAKLAVDVQIQLILKLGAVHGYLLGRISEQVLQFSLESLTGVVEPAHDRSERAAENFADLVVRQPFDLS